MFLRYLPMSLTSFHCLWFGVCIWRRRLTQKCFMCNSTNISRKFYSFSMASSWWLSEDCFSCPFLPCSHSSYCEYWYWSKSICVYNMLHVGIQFIQPCMVDYWCCNVLGKLKQYGCLHGKSSSRIYVCCFDFGIFGCVLIHFLRQQAKRLIE